ncbi:MAG: hypothetical protein HFI55_13060 [Lachnospiraceae bacterium]|jgi:capsular polysaccharide biosynthesis protein|nr:hypothetical protein [Lachnospiraceae bacterium]
MKDGRYADDGMDLKKYMMCLLGRLPLIFGALIGGALLGAVVYAAVRTVPESEREYQAFAKVYLDFAADETGEVYQAYNGYTWNDLMAADPIMELTLQNLPADYTREETEAAVRAEILSDIRLLTITVTSHRAERTDAILGAAVQALETYGGQAKEFLEIHAIQKTEARLVVADSRMAQAVFLGASLGLLLSLLGFSLCYVMDDRIFVAGDIRRVTEVSFLGYASGEETLKRDYETNLAYLREKVGNIQICEVERGKSFSEKELQEMRRADGVVLSLPFGAVHGAFLSYVTEQLRTQDCTLCGVAVRDADGRFLRKYYGRLGKQ